MDQSIFKRPDVMNWLHQQFVWANSKTKNNSGSKSVEEDGRWLEKTDITNSTKMLMS